MELEIEKTEVVSANNIQVEVPNEIEILEGKKDYEVSVVKREYTIVGDSIFIPNMYEDAPPWLKNLIDTTIDVAVTNRDQSLIDRLHSILTALDYVPKNRYTEQINQIISEDGIINSRIATLNSNLTDDINSTNATVAEINLTYASKEEAAAIAINALTASLSADGEIGSALIQLQEASADLERTTAQSISMLESVMEGEINGNATAMETIRTYVGIDKNGGTTGTGLLAGVSILQKQNDGVIETTAGTDDVMLGVENPNNNTGNDELDVTKEPYKSWRAADAKVGGVENRAMHVGDVYIKYSTAEHGYKTYEKAYKFIRTSVDDTSPYSTDAEGFTWALIVDTDAQNAYIAALNALDLANNKRRVFTTTPSGPYDEGDLWTKTTARGNVLYRANTDRKSGFLAEEWTEADDAALKDFEATVYEPKISILETQIDSQISYFYNHAATNTMEVTTQLDTWKSTWTTPELKAAHHGDIGIFTKKGTEGEAYAYSRKTDSWVRITDNAILKALMSAATAQATADNVVVSYYAIRQQDPQPAFSKLWFHQIKVGNVLKYVLQKYEEGNWVNVDVKQGDTLTTYDPVTKDTSIYLYNSDNWITEIENGIVASSEAITTLTANLGETDKKVSGHTDQLSTVDARIEGGVASVETKWAYNSTVKIDGVSYNSGFGLATKATSGSGLTTTGESEFWIKADKFKLMSADGLKKSSYSPFTVDSTTGEINFNGKVSFTNVTGTSKLVSTSNIQNAIDNNVTTIDGGKITAASILSHQIEANAIAGKNITGGTIRGTQIIGSVIKGSFIDLTTTLALTNWQHFTPSNVPSQYEANFAHYNEGGITVDSQGYVRLPGQQNFMVPSLVQSGTLYNGSLSNVTTTRSVTINKIWDLYSWDSYNVDTLQRSIRNNTQFSSNASLVFKGMVSCESNFGGSGTDVNNYGTYSFRFLNTDIVVSIQASNGNQHNAEITNVQFNGVTVAYADGRFGETPETDPSDSAFVNYSTTIKGVPVNIKTTFTGMAGFTFTFTATINNNTTINNHALGDVIKINSVSHSFNTANSSAAGQTTATYEINFPSVWVV